MHRSLLIGIVVAALGLVVFALRREGNPPRDRQDDSPVAIPAVREAAIRRPSAEPRFGSLRGRFVLDGDIPPEKVLVHVGDPKVHEREREFVTEDIPDESLLVDPETHGIANVCVYLRKAPLGIHPARQTSAEERVLCEIKGFRYRPHVLFARTDQIVVVKHEDRVPHCVHEYPILPPGFGQALRPFNERREREFPHKRPERVPMSVRCDFHLWMRAYWLVLDHPYAAITAPDGTFVIDDLPVGRHTFTVWHERPGYIARDLRVEIAPDSTIDLGTIPISPAKLAEQN